MSKKLSLFAAIVCTLLAAYWLSLALPAYAQGANPAVNTGSLRVVNALVAMGSVDVYVDFQRVAANLPPEAASAYLYVTAGKHNLSIRPAGADVLSTPIADLLIDLPPNNAQTAIVYQKQFAAEAFQPSFEQSGAIFLMSDDRSPTELGNTRLTAVHLAAGAPERLSIGYPSRASLLHQLGFEQPSGAIDIAAGSRSLNIIDSTSPDLVLLQRFGDQDFFANTLYTLVIVPDLTPEGFEVGPGSAQPRLFIVSAPIEPPDQEGIRLRLIHAAHSTLVVDIYIDGRLVASRVNYGDITEYLGLQSYSHSIAVRRFGASPDSSPLAQAEFTITLQNRQQKTWTLLLLNANELNAAALAVVQPGEGETQIINTPGGGMSMALLPDNISQTLRNYARIRLINAVDGIPSLAMFTPVLAAPKPERFDVTPTVTPAPTATPLPAQIVEAVLFGAEANDFEVPAGFYPELSIVPGGSNQKLLSVENVELIGGMVYTFVVLGSPAGDPPLEVKLLEDYGTGISLEKLFLGKITPPTANIRSGPGTTFGILTFLTKDSEVEVIGRNGNGEWLRIRFTDLATQTLAEGWIASNIIKVTRLGVPVNVLSLPEYTP